MGSTSKCESNLVNKNFFLALSVFFLILGFRVYVIAQFQRLVPELLTVQKKDKKVFACDFSLVSLFFTNISVSKYVLNTNCV